MLVSSETPSTAHNDSRWASDGYRDLGDSEDVANVTFSSTGYDITVNVNNVTDDVQDSTQDSVKGYEFGTIHPGNWSEQITVTSPGHKPNGSTATGPVNFPDDYGWISPYENPDSSVTWGVLVAIIVVVVCFFVAVILFTRYRRACQIIHRSMEDSANNPPSEQTEILVESSYDYIYKPLSGGILDEEYETTFVGVSIPLLQEVTRI